MPSAGMQAWRCPRLHACLSCHVTHAVPRLGGFCKATIAMCLLVQLVPPNITNIHHHQSDSLKNMLDDMTSHAWASVMLCKCAEATGLFAHSLVANSLCLMMNKCWPSLVSATYNSSCIFAPANALACGIMVLNICLAN